jgi:hypothetical protein
MNGLENGSEEHQPACQPALGNWWCAAPIPIVFNRIRERGHATMLLRMRMLVATTTGNMFTSSSVYVPVTKKGPLNQISGPITPISVHTSARQVVQHSDTLRYTYMYRKVIQFLNEKGCYQTCSCSHSGLEQCESNHSYSSKV